MCKLCVCVTRSSLVTRRPYEKNSSESKGKTMKRRKEQRRSVCVCVCVRGLEINMKKDFKPNRRRNLLFLRVGNA
jgi:hypothetical protein